MNISSIAARLLAGMVVCATPIFSAHAAEPLWRNAWTPPAPFSLSAAYTGSSAVATPASQLVVAAANGDLVLAAPSFAQFDFVLMRIARDGTLRWSSHIPKPAYYEGRIESLIATADGGAYAALSTDVSGNVVRIGADGGIAWSLPLAATSLSLTPSGRLVATDAKHVFQIDAATGLVAWQRRFDSVSAIAIGTDSSVYIDVYIHEAAPTHLVHCDASGRILWDITGAPGWQPPLAAGDGVAYLIGNGHLTAYRGSDGTVLWSTELDSGSTLWLVDGEPVVTGFNQAQRYAASDGHLRWTQSYQALGTIVATSGAIVVQTASGALAIDAQTGSIRWNVPLPANDADAHSLKFLTFTADASGRILAVGQPTGFGGRPYPAFLLPLDAASGAAQAPLALPSIQQNVSATSWPTPSGDIISAALSAGDPAQPLLFKRIGANDGASRWQSTHAWDSAAGVFGYEFRLYGVSSAQTSALVLGKEGSTYVEGLTFVTLLDNATGEVRWTRSLRATELYQQGEAEVSAPVFDDQGNVFVSVGAEVLCADSTWEKQCGMVTLYKLAADDGHVLWRIDSPLFTELSLIEAPAFTVIGNDAYLLGNIRMSDAPSVLARESGVDGSEVWSSSALADAGVWEVYPSMDGNLIIYGNGWAKIDAATGATLWAWPVPSDYPADCYSACAEYDSLITRDGDLFSAEQYESNARVLHMHDDGSGHRDALLIQPGNDALKSYPLRITQAGDDALWLELRRRANGNLAYLYVLAQFDPASPTLRSQQVMDASSVDTPVGAGYTNILAAPENGRLLMTDAWQRPGLPADNDVQALGTTIVAHGNLAIQADVDNPHVAFGDVLGVHARVTYSGDAPVHGATIVVYSPWPGGMSAATCSAIAAAACSVDTHLGTLFVTVDLQPGAVVDISAQANVLDAKTDLPQFEARVKGPIELDESDTTDNFAHANTIQGVFADGFDRGR